MLVFAVGDIEGAVKIFDDVLMAIEFSKKVNYRPTYLEVFDLKTGDLVKGWSAYNVDDWNETEIITYVNEYGGNDD